MYDEHRLESRRGSEKQIWKCGYITMSQPERSGNAREAAEVGSTGSTDTARLEAFSDGVFAVAITLLILDLHVPDPTRRDATLWGALLSHWQVYFAYIVSFLVILIMWINHHTLFKVIAYSDHLLMLFNGLLLMFIVVVPFSTSLLSTYLQEPGQPVNQHVAALIYSGVYVIIALLYNLVWRYAAHERRLLGKEIKARHVQRISNGYRYGPALYLAAFLLAFISVGASLFVNFALAVYFAVLPTSRKSTDEQDALAQVLEQERIEQ